MNNFNIYLAGAMSGLSFEEQNNWRKTVKDELESTCSIYRINCINPVDYYNFEDEPKYDNETEIMNFDLHKLKHSDLVVVNFNRPDSLETMAEIATAYELRIPVIGLKDESAKLHPWQECMCAKMFTDLCDMLFYIRLFYLS